MPRTTSTSRQPAVALLVLAVLLLAGVPWPGVAAEAPACDAQVEGEHDALDADGRTGAAEDADGDDVFGTIQAALDAAAAGARIRVWPGTYRETAMLRTEGVALVGPRSDACAQALIDPTVPLLTGAATIDGEGARGVGLFLLASGTTVAGLDVRGHVHVGVQVDGANNATVADMRASGNGVGIRAFNATDVLLQGNDASDNRVVGIWVQPDFTYGGHVLDTLEDGVLPRVSGRLDQLAAELGSLAEGDDPSTDPADWGLGPGDEAVLAAVPASRARILDNVAARNVAGIVLVYAAGDHVARNLAQDNPIGLATVFATGTLIEDNRIEGSADTALALLYSDTSMLRRNVVKDSLYGFDVDGYFDHDIDTTNTIDGLPIRYVNGAHGLIVDASESSAFLALVRSTNVTVRGVVVEGRAVGLLLAEVQGARIENVTARGNHDGVRILYSMGVEMIDSLVEGNQDGIVLAQALNAGSAITLEGNRISDNRYGVALAGSAIGTSLVGNRIDNNTVTGVLGVISQPVTGLDLRIQDNDVVGNGIVAGGGALTGGVFLYGSSGASVVSDNRFVGNLRGIGVWYSGSHASVIARNTIQDSHREGILFDRAQGDKVLENRLSGNEYGIRITGQLGLVLRGNVMEDNTYNLDVAHFRYRDFDRDIGIHAIDVTNTVDGKPVYYLHGARDLVIDASTNAGYVAIINGGNVTVRDLDLSNNGQGVIVSYSPGVRIENVSMSHVQYGILIHESSDVALIRVNISVEGDRGLTRGVLARVSDRLVIEESRFARAYHGVELSQTRNATVKGNVFEDNVRDDPDGSGGAGLYTFFSEDVLVTDNEFRNNSKGIVIYCCNPGSGSDLIARVEANRIVDNERGVWVWGMRGVVEIIGNEILRNTDGVTLSEYFPQYYSGRAATVEVHENLIRDNVRYGVLNAFPQAHVVLDATGNDWGDASGPSSPDGAQPLVDATTGLPAQGDGDAISEGSTSGVANVRFDPYEQLPRFEPVPTQTVREGLELSFVVVAHDPEGDVPALEASQLPDGATFVDAGDGTGRFTWTPGYAQAGAQEASFIAVDGRFRATLDVLLDVTDHNTPPLLDFQETHSLVEGQAFRLTLAVNDAEGDELGVTVDGLPEGANFDADEHALSWTPGFTQHGEHDMIVRASDGRAQSERALRLTVADAETAPIIDPIAPVEWVETLELTLLVNARDEDGETPTLRAFGLPPGAAFADHGNGAGTLTWTPTRQQEGEYVVRFQARDDDSDLQVEQSVRILVADLAGAPVVAPLEDRTVLEGERLDVKVNAADPEGDALTYSASGLPAGAMFDAQARLLSWRPTHDQAGLHNIILHVTDGHDEGSTSLRIEVLDVDRAPRFAPLVTTQAVALRELRLSVAASDPDGGDVTLDAPALPAGAVFDGTTGELAWTPRADEVGEHALSVVATSTGGATSWLNATLLVLGNRAPTLVVDAPPRVTVGEPIALSVNAVDPEGGAVSVAWTVVPADGGEPVTFEGAAPTHAFATPGLHTLAVRATDEDGFVSETSMEILVDDYVRVEIVAPESAGPLDEVEGIVRVVGWDGAGVPGAQVQLRVDHVTAAGSLMVHMVSFTTDVDGVATFRLPRDTPLSNLPGEHRLLAFAQAAGTALDDVEHASSAGRYEVGLA